MKTLWEEVLQAVKGQWFWTRALHVHLGILEFGKSSSCLPETQICCETVSFLDEAVDVFRCGLRALRYVFLLSEWKFWTEGDRWALFLDLSSAFSCSRSQCSKPCEFTWVELAPSTRVRCFFVAVSFDRNAGSIPSWMASRISGMPCGGCGRARSPASACVTRRSRELPGHT